LGDKEEMRKYAVSMNAKRLGLGGIIPETSGGSFVYTIPLQTAEDQTCDFQIVDLEKDRVISRFAVRVIPGFSVKFNRDFYFSSEDFEEAHVTVESLHGSKRYEMNSNDEMVSFPYDDGSVEIKIPMVYVRNHEGQKWNRGYTAWIKQIKQDEKIYITMPEGCSCNMKLGTVDITEETKACFDYGNAVFAYSRELDSKWVDLVLTISKDRAIQKYNIGRISLTEQFAGEVRFDYHDSTLFWNKGMGFIGNPNGQFKLRIEAAEGFKEYPLNLNDEVIIGTSELAVNEYRYSIVKESENIFLGDETILDEGTLFIGDKNELRFNQHVIAITNITFEEGGDLRSVDIRNTYIDRIEYKGIQFVDSEERECPVYSGVMFFMGQSMRHHAFSFEDKISEKGFQLYKINPVKIVFINDHTLSITNEDGDGIYYYRYFDKSSGENRYSITDREPTIDKQRYYYLADLYTYRKTRVE
jgi:DNA-directed RNA polymerase, alpha subunit/40 kD subunit